MEHHKAWMTTFKKVEEMDEVVEMQRQWYFGVHETRKKKKMATTHDAEVMLSDAIQ